MRVFKEKFNPIEIVLTNRNNQEFSLKSLFITTEKMDRIETVIHDNSLTASRVSVKLMVEYFGKDEKFYEQFSPNQLREVAEYIGEEQKKN